MERVEDQKHGSRGIITNIQRLCTHDGPGSRTTVFQGLPVKVREEAIIQRRRMPLWRLDGTKENALAAWNV